MDAQEQTRRSLVLVCKREFEDELREEIILRTGRENLPIEKTGGGLLIVEGLIPEQARVEPRPPTENASDGGRRSTAAVTFDDGGTALVPTSVLLNRPLIFERQRIENAMLIPTASLKQMAREILRHWLRPIITSNAAWTCHAFATEVPEAESLSARARNLERVLLDFVRERYRLVFRRYLPPDELEVGADAHVLNLCLTAEGIWGSVMPRDRLSDARPGGLHRMAWDSHAPARSYLKLEEAFDAMGEKPQRGQTVIDLGASPGGWSYACLKRGCRVTAVDNGAIKIRQPERYGGTFLHLKENGVTFEPEQDRVPVDWLVSDMLIVAGTNIGMLRKWFANRWMRRFVVNLKIPQIHAYPVLVPVEEFLSSVPGIRYHLRQLYHDRREVTLFGWLL